MNGTEAEFLDELQNLHHRYGYGGLERFIIALRAARRGIFVPPRLGNQRKQYTRKTPQLLEHFLALTTTGKTIAEISAILNISQKSVTDLRLEYGFSKPRRRRRKNLA